MSSQLESILKAARADDIPAAESGLWRVRKFSLSRPLTVPRDKGRSETLPPGDYTALQRFTIEEAMQGGALVMHVCPAELKKHAEFMLRAFGRVLITGLGLGCVTRGVLANPKVECVVVLEKELDVLRLVQPYMPKDRRLIILHVDALKWIKTAPNDFDCAWHDLWQPPELEKKTHLQVLHMELICELRGKVKMQGAWEFPREFRKSMSFAGVI